jgi:hypothetical protein
MTILKNQGHKLSDVCHMLGMSRQSYYKRLKHEEAKSTLYNHLENLVYANRQKKSRVGLRTIFYKENIGSFVGLNQFEQLMSKRGYSLKPYKSYMKTTDSRGRHYKYENLINGLEINGENQLIVGDITYFKPFFELYFIFHFIDYYTLEVKGLLANTNMEGINAEKTIRQVLAYNKRKKYGHNMIVHTDGGGQYRSHNFQGILVNAEIRPSQAVNCFQNGLSERVNGIIKNEYLVDYEINSLSQLNKVLKKIKHDINNVWPSKRLGYKTPKQFAEEAKNITKEDRIKIKIKTE